MTQKRAEPTTTEQAAALELVRMTRAQGLSLTGPDGLLKQLTKTVAGDLAEREDDRAPGLREA